MKKNVIALMMTLLLSFACFANIAQASNDPWVDFIEGSTDYWCKEMANDIYSGTVSDVYSNKGVPAYRIELRNDDSTVHSSKRSEIAKVDADAAAGEYVYKFSIMLPEGGAEDYALDPHGSEIIAQWHNTPDPGEEWTSPPLAIHTGSYYNQPDHYTLELNYDASPMSTDDTLKRARFDLGSFSGDKGQWVDWEVHVKWGWLPSQSPLIEISKDGVLIFKTTQPNTTNDQEGVRMKLGVYKWDWAQTAEYNHSILDTRIIYFDNVSIVDGNETAALAISPDQLAAQSVIDQINQLPSQISLTDQAAVEAARAAYDVLTGVQQELVTNYSMLTAAEATIDQLLIDLPAAQPVIDQIDQLPTEITLGDQAGVEEARAAYNALTDAQQALVTNYSKLTAAEATIEQLVIDLPVAQIVIDQIDKVPTEISLDDQDTVEAARAAYDALTDSQQALVTNYSKLTLAETVIEELLANQGDSTLSALKLSSGTLTPQFESNTTSYVAKVANTVNSVTVTATTNGTGATMEVNGVNVDSGHASQSISLAVGSNTIDVQVTAINGNRTNYTIDVTRSTAVKSSDNTLKDLTLNTGIIQPGFSSSTTQYVTTVSRAVTSIKLTPTVNDDTATVTVNGKSVISGQVSQNVTLKMGKNTIKIVVTAENGKTKTYILTVTRK